jgi:hypothetical protein
MSVLAMVSALQFDNWQVGGADLWAHPSWCGARYRFTGRPHPRVTKPLSTIHCRAT